VFHYGFYDESYTRAARAKTQTLVQLDLGIVIDNCVEYLLISIHRSDDSKNNPKVNSIVTPCYSIFGQKK